MSVFGAMNVSATGMTAQQTRVDIISQNIANVNTTRDADGNVYKRKTVVFAEKDFTCFSDVLGGATANIGKGVKIAKIVEDNETECRKVYDPSNPDADADGYVTYPNVFGSSISIFLDMHGLKKAISSCIFRYFFA